FVNDSDTTQETLDWDCGLYSDTAKHIIKARDRAGEFATIQELADVNQVGIASLQTLESCADHFGYGEEHEVYYDSLQAVYDENHALSSVIKQLMMAGNPCDECGTSDPNVWWACNPVRFGEVTAFVSGGTVTRYEVRLLQMVDPECGVQLTIHWDLDADYETTNYECYM
ncbi:MAG: hypothetical protein JRI23_07710, partial [Deltaproteobacteria bacterium]|nr:hypothetical protein [Deltaproteobacteria bacterium]MBW2531491.1 hypothetical protein [Deltaproteobacteria bacterium]